MPSSGGDTTAPAVTRNVSASNDQEGQITISWSPNSESDLSGYIVRRSTAQGSGYAPVTAKISSTSFVDTDVDAGTTYYYVVQAIDTSNNYSDYSQPASGSALESEPDGPGQPGQPVLSLN
jgi:fibronectin type 3 domain-containing protein